MVDDRRREGEEDGRGPEGAPEADEQAVEWSSWTNLWQVPAILISGVVIAAGLYVAMRSAPDNDFDGALDQVDQLIASEQFDLAAGQLNEVLEPNLDAATPAQQARFEAVVADWISLSQAAAGLELEKNNRRIDEHYTRAVDYGLVLEPPRIERWAHALISLGDLTAAQQRLKELEALAKTDQGLDARRRRNQVLRRLVEISLQEPDGDFDTMMEMLQGYRTDPLLAPADEVWAVVRQAELRIELAEPEEAVARLLVDMRRFDPGLADDADVGFGELYALLARGYYEMGNLPYAEYHVEQALERLGRTDPVRGDVMVLLGQIAVSRGEWHEAFDHFDEVLRDFALTRSALPGQLGRAEVSSVLGDDDRSVADYRTLHQALTASRPRRDMTGADVARSLVHRHDAALTMGKLPAALDYILLAETFHEVGHVPQDIVYRIASTSRQIADNQIADARGVGGEPAATRLVDLPPAVRYEANEHYRRAARYYVRHARALAGRPGADELWAESLWLGGDSYALGGWHADAITHFLEYVAGRSDADPRRPEAVFRLAQAGHAEMDYETAVTHYEQVLVEHPRSHVASRSHVPLARCLLAIGRRPEAERQLLLVVSGKAHLEPEAVDYRDALIELGQLYYENEDYVGAIERLDEAVRRYPSDSRINEIRFRLADSYRRRAIGLEPQLSSPGLPPGERRRLEAQRSDHLQSASELFEAICDGAPAAAAGPEQLLRYACLYQADCAFELGRYADAVVRYDHVAGRFHRHHTSMTALIQIVNCYTNLGDLDRARAAHRRALLRLRELPDEAFKEPDALLDREAWERWLKNMPVGQNKPIASANG